MVTNAWADRVEAVQTDFGYGVLLRDNTFQLFQGWGSTPCPCLWAPMVRGVVGGAGGGPYI